MRIGLKLDASGNILYTAAFAVKEDEDPSLFYLENPDPIDTVESYFKDGMILNKGPRPSEFHEWLNYSWTYNQLAQEQAVRNQRDSLLYACDYTQLSDIPGATRTAWADYRKKLRDITDQPGFPSDVVWPNKPV